MSTVTVNYLFTNYRSIVMMMIITIVNIHGVYIRLQTVLHVVMYTAKMGVHEVISEVLEESVTLRLLL